LKKKKQYLLSVVPAEDARLNLNTATAEMIAKRLPGVGYTTAKRIVELKMSLSGERFTNLKQLENIPRVNWEQFITDDIIFIA
jgi:DNA uptake protein ComE-like DNA-binding protein